DREKESFSWGDRFVPLLRFFAGGRRGGSSPPRATSPCRSRRSIRRDRCRAGSLGTSLGRLLSRASCRLRGSFCERAKGRVSRRPCQKGLERQASWSHGPSWPSASEDVRTSSRG